MQKLLWISLLLSCSACTTIEDFQAMNPDERAEKVCSASSAARQRRAGLMSLNDRIAAQETLLTNGYRVYENCQVMPVYIPAVVVDCSGKSADDLANCQRKSAPAHTEYRRVCREVAVPIDYNAESAILRNLHMARDDQQMMYEQLRADCLDRARALSPAEAYSAYLKHAEP